MRSPGETAEAAQAKYDKFLNDKLEEAVGLACAGDIRGAEFAFGEGLHGIMDSTSPAHAGFQEWTGEPGTASIVFGFLTSFYTEKTKRAIAHVNLELTITPQEFQTTVALMKEYREKYEELVCKRCPEKAKRACCPKDVLHPPGPSVPARPSVGSSGGLPRSHNPGISPNAD